MKPTGLSAPHPHVCVCIYVYVCVKDVHLYLMVPYWRSIVKLNKNKNINLTLEMLLWTSSMATY